MIATLVDKAEATSEMYAEKGRRIIKTLGDPFVHEIDRDMLSGYNRQAAQRERPGARPGQPTHDQQGADHDPSGPARSSRARRAALDAGLPEVLAAVRAPRGLAHPGPVRARVRRARAQEGALGEPCSAPLLVIASLLGHSSTRMVEKVYGRLSAKNMDDAIAVLPVFGEVKAVTTIHPAGTVTTVCADMPGTGANCRLPDTMEVGDSED
jgi:hypothetical protein